MRRIFWGFCINRFGIGPLIYASSRSDFSFEFSRVADPYPDSDWIRIQSGQWIRIRIQNPDPDPGGQKLPTKVESS